jgi:hypothetical protein
MNQTGKSWGYRYVFKDMFPYLYGKTTIQRNRLSLTDEDASEYKTFEALTFKGTIYEKSKVMLCTFHVIWKQFKEYIPPTLPKDCLLLSQNGRESGKYVSSSISPFKTMSHNFFFLL